MPTEESCEEECHKTEEEEKLERPCDNEPSVGVVGKEERESHMTMLPGHVIITHASQLPDHFRRVTTKYTRNSLQPCVLPRHLVAKPTLLLPRVRLEGVASLRKREGPRGESAVSGIAIRL